MGACLDFVQQLGILPDLFRFRGFEWRNYTAAVKGNWLKSLAAITGCALVRAFLHVLHKLQSLDRIEVENRFCLTLVIFTGEVAAQNQKVVEILTVIKEKVTFNLAAIFVFQGKVKQGFNPVLLNVRSYSDRGKSRVTARIVSD